MGCDDTYGYEPISCGLWDTLVSNLEVQCMAAKQYMHMEVSNLNMRPNYNVNEPLC